MVHYGNDVELYFFIICYKERKEKESCTKKKLVCTSA